MSETGHDLRRAARAGFKDLTVGRAPRYVQANIVLVPKPEPDDLEAFYRQNAIACPLIARGRAGELRPEAIGDDIDLRTELPDYFVRREGVATCSADITNEWRDDLVSFAIGCWFGAEAALRAVGIGLRHFELGLQGPLLRTERATVAAGCFGGPLVVSMLPLAERDVEAVVATSSLLHLSHGAPLHRGESSEVGIRDPDHPDWGEPLVPGAMLVTNLVEETARCN